MRFAAFVFSMLFLLVGCAPMPTQRTYSGPPRAVSEVAVVETESYDKFVIFFEYLNEEMFITHVDGVALKTDSWASDPHPRSAEVVPGPHTFDVYWKTDNGISYATGRVSGVFEAGKYYVIRQEPGKDSVRFWVEEAPRPEAGKKPEFKR